MSSDRAHIHKHREMEDEEHSGKRLISQKVKSNEVLQDYRLWLEEHDEDIMLTIRGHKWFQVVRCSPALSFDSCCFVLLLITDIFHHW